MKKEAVDVRLKLPQTKSGVVYVRLKQEKAKSRGVDVRLNLPQTKSGVVYVSTKFPQTKNGAVYVSTNPGQWKVEVYTFVHASEKNRIWLFAIKGTRYNRAPARGSISTTISYGPDSNNKYLTTYFRRTFDYTFAGNEMGKKP